MPPSPVEKKSTTSSWIGKKSISSPSAVVIVVVVVPSAVVVVVVVVVVRFGAVVKRIAWPWAGREMVLPPGWLGAAIVTSAQIVTEFHHSGIRRKLLKLDDNLGDMLAYAGRAE